MQDGAKVRYGEDYVISSVQRESLVKSSKTRVAVLLSGGIDSAATLAVYHRKKAVIDAIFID